MNKEKYLTQRNEIYSEAEKLINEGKIEEANAKIEEIKNLDQQFENEAKAMANLNALKDNVKAANIEKFDNANKVGKIIDSIGNNLGEDFTNSMEYRKAFMNYVQTGTPISREFKNADASTKTSDVGEMIPQTVLEKIVEKMEVVGIIYNLVTKTSYKGGLKIPTSSVKPTASWVAEGAGSNKQKKTTGSISFAYNKLRCAVSSSLEVETMSLAVFETTFIKNVSEAMIKAIEQAIISGTGSNQPTGILSETVVTGQNVDVAKTAKVTYETLVNAEAALPLAYEGEAKWFMTKKTFMAFIGMTDDNKQPIARVNYGINGKPERTLLGRQVILNDYMTSINDTLTSDTVVAFLFNPADYVLNSNLNMTIKKYEDNDTDDMVTKAIMLVDGKVVDKNSLVTITKKSA